jgi:hypothetical protein
VNFVTRKTIVAMLIVTLAALSLMLIMPVRATQTPSVPEFTVKFLDGSYNVSSTNPYTGLTETNTVTNNSIEVTIKNQPFDYSNNQIYYNVRMEPHFANDWTELFPVENLTSSINENGFSYSFYIFASSPQAKSSYTTVTLAVLATDVYQATGFDIQSSISGVDRPEGSFFASLRAIPAGGQIDFQVEALIGHASQTWIVQHPLTPTYGGYFEPAVAYDSASGWSSTQTVTVGEGASTSTPNTSPSIATPNPTAFPQQSSNPTGTRFSLSWEQTVIVVLVVLVAALLVVVGLLWRKITKK